MTKASGISKSSVQRIWPTFGLQPHRSETIKLSTDPLLAEKVRDIVALYMAPPSPPAKHKPQKSHVKF